MKKYIYKHKTTGQKIYSDFKLDREDLELVREMRNTKMANDKIIKKSRYKSKKEKNG